MGRAPGRSIPALRAGPTPERSRRGRRWTARRGSTLFARECMRYGSVPRAKATLRENRPTRLPDSLGTPSGSPAFQPPAFPRFRQIVMDAGVGSHPPAACKAAGSGAGFRFQAAGSFPSRPGKVTAGQPCLGLAWPGWALLVGQRVTLTGKLGGVTPTPGTNTDGAASTRLDASNSTPARAGSPG